MDKSRTAADKKAREQLIKNYERKLKEVPPLDIDALKKFKTIFGYLGTLKAQAVRKANRLDPEERTAALISAYFDLWQGLRVQIAKAIEDKDAEILNYLLSKQSLEAAADIAKTNKYLIKQQAIIDYVQQQGKTATPTAPTKYSEELKKIIDATPDPITSDEYYEFAIAQITDSLLTLKRKTDERQATDTYFYTKRGGIEAAFDKININKKTAQTLQDRANKGTSKKGRLAISLNNISDLKGIRTSTRILLDVFNEKFTRDGCQNIVIEIPLKDYAIKRGKPIDKNSLDALRREVSEDLYTLKNMDISYIPKKDEWMPGSFYNTSVIQSRGIINGIITVKLNDDYYNYLKTRRGVATLPQWLARLADRKHPHAYYLAKGMCTYYGQQLQSYKGETDRPIEVILTVKKLLECCLDLPTVEKVRETDRAIKRRIIDPFENDLEYLENYIKWEYCHEHGAPLTEAELEKTGEYDFFITLRIKYSIPDYPAQRLLENKQKRIETATAKNKRPAKRRTPKETPNKK